MEDLITFQQKYNFSEQAHDQIAWWYNHNFKCYEKINSSYIQKLMDIDLLVVPLQGLSFFVEEKFLPKSPYKYMAIETVQNTKRNHPGWIYITQADILAWHYCPVGKNYTYTYWIDAKKLKEYYFTAGGKYKHVISDNGPCKLTRPENCIIPWEDILDNVGYKYYNISYKVMS